MRIPSILAAATMAVVLSGCYTYPVYQRVPVARLTPEQSAAIATNPQLSQADRDRLTRDDAQVALDDRAERAYGYAPYAYAPVAPTYYVAPYAYNPYFYGYGYPYYYGGFYPGVSLSLGFRGYYGGHHGGFHGGGFRGHR